MTRPFTCRAIARPLARLAIARFYVYGLLAIFVSSGMIPLDNDESKMNFKGYEISFATFFITFKLMLS